MKFIRKSKENSIEAGAENTLTNAELKAALSEDRAAEKKELSVNQRKGQLKEQSKTLSTAQIKEQRKEEKRKQKEQKKRDSLFGKMKFRINLARLLFNLLSMLLYTLFTVIMLLRHWGNSTLLYILLGFLGFYILLFSLIIILSLRSSKRLNRSVKDYKSGLKILRSLLRLVSFILSLSVLGVAAAATNIGTPFQIAVLVISLSWAIFQIAYQLSRILKRHGIIGKKRKSFGKRKG